MHFTFSFPSALQLKDNDAAAQMVITSQSPAAKVVNQATTTKATPGDVQGTV